MSLTDWAVRLAELHEQPQYAACRFDAEHDLVGRIAVLPSAFNPPTRAHFGLLDVALAAAGGGGAAALLTTNNVDKAVFGAPLAHRIGMLVSETESRPELAVLASNAARIADQADALRGTFPHAEFDFVVGFDTLVRIFEPKYYEDFEGTLERFFGKHRVIATNRAEATAGSIRDFMASGVAADYARRVVVAELDQERARLSSTSAREAIAEGETPGALTPQVHAYIERHKLYGAGT